MHSVAEYMLDQPLGQDEHCVVLSKNFPALHGAQKFDLLSENFPAGQGMHTVLLRLFEYVFWGQPLHEELLVSSWYSPPMQLRQ